MEMHIHEHHNLLKRDSLHKAFLWGIALNVIFVLVEFFFGFLSDSMGLLSDAGHNLGDVASLVLALLAFRLSGINPNKRFTYGYKRSTILVSLVNSVILLVAVVFIIVESISKILNPVPVEGGTIIIVAGIGVVVNAVTALLFMRDKDKDMNVKGAYLHMAADALVSIGVVVSGIIISFTGWYIIDPVIGLAVAVIIIFSTVELLGDSLRLALDGVPRGIDPAAIEREIDSQDGVSGSHHIHIWALSTTETALTAHVVLYDISRMEEIKHILKQKLKHDGICHVTFEFEDESYVCDDKNC
ncbi:MAG: cation diffusion facilitator family transporter [Bacteroidales bacterium]|jgi:cobalt-zinc-cadmium efflux system protein|nr:cation diffusion facilitator family transporter [Bacteroidales bacterium]